jgi:hypothetical protein
MLKFDVTLPQRDMRDVELHTVLHPIQNLNKTLVGYDAEITLKSNSGSIIIALDEIAQLDEAIEKLQDLRKLWAEKIRKEFTATK